MCIQHIELSNENQAVADHAAIREIARHLYEARRRCGPKAKLRDRLHYQNVAFELPPGIEGARLLYERLGAIPAGMSLDRIDPCGPYSLDNLKYSSPREQALNTRHAARFWS